MADWQVKDERTAQLNCATDPAIHWHRKPHFNTHNTSIKISESVVATQHIEILFGFKAEVLTRLG